MDKNFTGIVEFEMIKPLSFGEKMNAKIQLSQWGKFFMGDTMVEFTLKEMLQYPERFKPTVIIEQGEEVKL